jgi:hypothetical protein
LTNDDNEHNGDHAIEVPSGSLRITGFPAGVLVEAGNTAVQSLSTATDVASSTGHDDVATATEALQVNLQTRFHVTSNHVNIYQQQTININQQTITEIHNQIENYTKTLEAHNVSFFECKEAYEQCMSGAADTGEKLHCQAVYAGCLGCTVITKLTPFL